MSKKPSKKLLKKRKAFLALFYCFYDVRYVKDRRYEIVERVTNQMIGYIVFTEPRTLNHPHQVLKQPPP